MHGERQMVRKELGEENWVRMRGKKLEEEEKRGQYGPRWAG